jgi:hypothetical protein
MLVSMIAGGVGLRLMSWAIDHDQKLDLLDCGFTGITNPTCNSR